MKSQKCRVTLFLGLISIELISCCMTATIRAAVLWQMKTKSNDIFVEKAIYSLYAAYLAQLDHLIEWYL